MHRLARPAARLLGLAALLGAPLPACAHDFWISPASFRPEPGSRVALHLEVGERFEGARVPRAPDRIERFVLAGAGGNADVPGIAGADPAGVATIPAAGAWLAGYRSRPTPIELPAETFESYLREEGLDRVLGARAARGESGKPGREIYSRCAKALLVAGDRGAAGFDRVLGFRLEIVPETNPGAVPGEFVARLLFEGRPLEGALVSMIRKGAPPLASVRSDREGRARFPVDAAGVWLVKAVHMLPAPDPAVADWESLWASLVFEVR
jgi:uncharacterized GH25 family protein